jgi:hypothetical protein
VSVPEPLRGALAVRAQLPKWVVLAATRAHSLNQAATTRLVAEIEQKHIRVGVTHDGRHLLDRSRLSAEGGAFLSDPGNRLMIGLPSIL